MENKEWLGFGSFTTEETVMKKKALLCKTLNEIMALYSIDPGTVNISKLSTLSPMTRVDNTVISEFDPIGRTVEMMRENSADVHTQNINHQYVMKRRVGRNGTTNSITKNPSIVNEVVGGEIKHVKQLSFIPTIEVDNADYFNKIDTDDETQKALRSHGKLKKEALLVVNKEQLPVEKQKSLNMAFEWREYERCLTILQQTQEVILMTRKIIMIRPSQSYYPSYQEIEELAMMMIANNPTLM